MIDRLDMGEAPSTKGNIGGPPAAGGGRPNGTRVNARQNDPYRTGGGREGGSGRNANTNRRK